MLALGLYKKTKNNKTKQKNQNNKELSKKSIVHLEKNNLYTAYSKRMPFLLFFNHTASSFLQIGPC